MGSDSDSVTAEELRLLDAARRVSARAHAPYSGVHVGAALLDSKGGIHTGCNVENVSFGLTICAERAAVTRAVADGHRDFVAIAVHASTPEAFPPCGACRQVLAEFTPRLRVVWQGQDAVPKSAALGELLGHMLTPEDLPSAAASKIDNADDSKGETSR
ncbi:MAG: cytidine deaminase [Planctomycetota bacterium]|jgi:cytidine deaminase